MTPAQKNLRASLHNGCRTHWGVSHTLHWGRTTIDQHAVLSTVSLTIDYILEHLHWRRTSFNLTRRASLTSHSAGPVYLLNVRCFALLHATVHHSRSSYRINILSSRMCRSNYNTIYSIIKLRLLANCGSNTVCFTQHSRSY